MTLVLREADLHSPVSPSVESPPLLSSPAFSCTSPPQALSLYPPPEEYWLEQFVRITKWHTSAKVIRLTPAEPHTERFTAALEKECVKYELPGVSESEGPGGYQYKVNLHHVRPAPECCTFESYLARALQAATLKTAVLIPHKQYTELFAQKLEREGISYEVQAAIEPEAITEQYRRSNFIVYLSTAEPSFTITSSLAELMEKSIIPCRGGRVVRIIPSAQTPLLAKALNEKDIPYHLAHPCSERDSRKEYEVDLTKIVLE